MERKRIKYDKEESKSKFPYLKYKNEFNLFLKTIGYREKNLTDFWTFFDKLQAHSIFSNSENEQLQKSSLLCECFKDVRSLYNTFPSTDRHGAKIPLSFINFQFFINCINLYKDFKLKQKFVKLKSLRTAQKKLPICQYRSQIIDSLKKHQIILIAGDTGCGKSTQIPQYIYDAGYKNVVCTQPRRIACISLSKRVAYETLTEYKTTVGYQIRFEKSKNASTRIIFMTEGLLLRQMNETDIFNTYDVIILDEIHERHLYGDFLIGIMKCLVQKKKDFKLILMSATINIQMFKTYFSNENIDIIQVPGRLYPIKIEYRPIAPEAFKEKTKKFNSSPYLQIIQLIDEQYKPHQKGDVLIFLNGVAEINSLTDVIKEYSEIKKNWIVLPLHSRLSIAQQDQIFNYAPEGIRKCIISTNIAETSVTIDGIRFVIDSGKMNQMTYENSKGINQLNEIDISQDNARQRSGRAGRTGPGICYRLYSEEHYNKMQKYSTAEIHLVPLETLILQMVSLGISDITSFPFLEKPSGKALETALEQLKFYGAMELKEEELSLTLLGEVLNKLPVDLRIGKMLVTSTLFGRVFSVLTLASLLSIQSPYTTKAFQDSKCEESRRSMESNHGDPITLYNIFKEWLQIKQDRSENTKAWARKRGIEEQRFYEVIKLISNFKDILQGVNLLNEISDGDLTSAERKIRKGELKQLRTLRHELKNNKANEKKRTLNFRECMDDEYHEDNSEHDIRDVEFRILNDWNSMQELLVDISVNSYKEIMLLKILITNGLYPQIAIADEHNNVKTVSESLFHTKNKQFVFLHPTSHFARNMDILNLSNDEIEVPPAGYFSRRPISQKHTVLIYQSILETKKVYLMNTMRMPALQTLMLFSKDIHTNEMLTKFVFDQFISADVPNVGQGKTLLSKAVSLRKRMRCILNEKLRGTYKKNEEVDDLINDLVAYIQTAISYNMKRLLPADLKVCYLNYSVYKNDMPKINPFDADHEMTCNDKYGGLQVTENIVYNCLIEEDWSINLTNEYNSTSSQCQKCDNLIMGSFLDKAIHENTCCSNSKEDENASEKTNVAQVKPNAKPYFCDNCKTDFMLTAVDILKHKKQCKT